MTWPASPAEIARLIPHQGRMGLLDAVLTCTPTHISCRASSHHAADHPLRSPTGLLSPVGIEYAAQAMALHGALNAKPGVTGRPGFLASARGVTLHVPRLEDVAGVLMIEVEHLAGDQRQAMNRFALHDETGRPVVEGGGTVVLDTQVTQ